MNCGQFFNSSSANFSLHGIRIESELVWCRDHVKTDCFRVIVGRILVAVGECGDLLGLEVCKLTDHVGEAYGGVLEVRLVQIDKCVDLIYNLFTDFLRLKNLRKWSEFIVCCPGVNVIVEC